jgi:NAD(P)-binding Rossmann-like domain
MSRAGAGTASSRITIVGGGIAGLTAAVACAEGGASVTVLEAHATLGGRARTDDGQYKANFGPHALYSDGPFWSWLVTRKLLPRCAGVPLASVRFRWQGELRRMPPLTAIPAVLRMRGREAPVELDFRTWAAEHTDERMADLASGAAGVYTFHHDPGELSAAFIWPRTIRALLSPPPPARYPVGGWAALVDSLARRARELGVILGTGERVQVLPEPPVIVATELADAGRLLGEPSLSWLSGRTVCIDLGLRHRRGDPYVVSDCDEAGWIERFSAADSSLAPDGEELVQAQMPIRPDESSDQTTRRLECLLDAAFPAWRERTTWQRRQVMSGRSGALDMPGQSWRDRPSIDRGEGVFLAGDMVAAPGLLSEVSWASAVEASKLALGHTSTSKPSLRSVA